MTSYEIVLPVFQGPLDLLLHLIERQELDITEVSLAQVTNQFLDSLAQISERDPDSLADFLVVAAKLLVIKSRALLPRPAAPLAPEEEDVGEDLVQQLIEYRKFKGAARWLKDLESQGHQSFVRLASSPRLEQTLDLGDVRLEDLLSAVRRALQISPPLPSIDGAVPPLTISISDQIRRISRELRSCPSLSFLGLLQGSRGRLEIVVTLLAVLEMVKQRRIRMRQDQLFGDILIMGLDAAEAHAQPTLVSA